MRPLPRRLRPVLAVTILALAGLLARPAAAEPPPAASPESRAWLTMQWARTDLAALAAAARRWRDEHGAWPAACDQPGRTYLQPPPRTDPWGSAYGCRSDGGGFTVLSPGPDGLAGTADDLVLEAGSGRSSGAVDPHVPPTAPATAPHGAAASPDEAATALSLQRLGEALESYRRKEGRYPVADRIEHLERWLVAEHLAPAAWTTVDAWGRPLRYRTTDVGSSYTLASAGSDGRWESLPAGEPPPFSEGSDLVLADGRVVRGPSAEPPASPPPGTAAAVPEPQDPLATTQHRMQELVRRIAAHRSDGRHPQSDDAERLARELGAGPATDGWGRPLLYLSAEGGRLFALVSAGPDGRLAADMEGYARGTPAQGDDLVLHGPSSPEAASDN